MSCARLIFLGTGTSDGVPQVGCSCGVCTGADPKDRRLRSSVYMEIPTAGGFRSLLIDTSMDFRQQLLRLSAEGRVDSLSVQAVFYTHAHSDHLFGLADIRPLTRIAPITVYADSETEANIRKRFDYIFNPNPVQSGGGLPRIQLMPVGDAPIDFFGVPVVPIPVMHGTLPITAWRIGAFAYITDANFISEASYRKLEGVQTLVINALRDRPHSTHFSVREAVAAADRIGAQRVFFTHICHSISHRQMEALTPSHMHPAYDGLELSVPL